MAVKTQGTQLYVLDDTASGGAEILTVLCATSLSGLGSAREQIDVTCLESDFRLFEGGLATPGALSITLNFDPSNESHYRLYELWKANTNFKFAIGFSDGTVAPTIDSAGDFDFATSRTYVEAEGYVVDVPIDISLNAVVTATIPVQVSGEYTIFRKVA